MFVMRNATLWKFEHSYNANLKKIRPEVSAANSQIMTNVSSRKMRARASRETLHILIYHIDVSIPLILKTCDSVYTVTRSRKLNTPKSFLLDTSDVGEVRL